MSYETETKDEPFQSELIGNVQKSGQVKWHLSRILAVTIYTILFIILALFPFYVAYTFGKFSESASYGTVKRSNELRQSAVVVLFVLLVLILVGVYRRRC